MTLQELHALVRQGESQYLEFKAKVNHPEKIIREIIAFANTKGGRLIIGVHDDGNIVGLKDATEAHFHLQQAIQKLCTQK